MYTACDSIEYFANRKTDAEKRERHRQGETVTHANDVDLAHNKMF